MKLLEDKVKDVDFVNLVVFAVSDKSGFIRGSAQFAMTDTRFRRNLGRDQ